MTSGKVKALYMTMPDMMRSGHRMTVDDFDCDPDGIIGDLNYDTSEDKVLLLTSQKSYELIDEADLYVDQGALTGEYTCRHRSLPPKSRFCDRNRGGLPRSYWTV